MLASASTYTHIRTHSQEHIHIPDTQRKEEKWPPIMRPYVKGFWSALQVNNLKEKYSGTWLSPSCLQSSFGFFILFLNLWKKFSIHHSEWHWICGSSICVPWVLGHRCPPPSLLPKLICISLCSHKRKTIKIKTVKAHNFNNVPQKNTKHSIDMKSKQQLQFFCASPKIIKITQLSPHIICVSFINCEVYPISFPSLPSNISLLLC